MPVVTFLEDLCKKDGICASVCPAHVIKGPKGQLPVMRPEKETACIACGQCMAFCPHGAVRVDALPESDMQRLTPSLLPSAESMDMLFKARRSIRRYKEMPVPKTLLEDILAETRYAPSAKNSRPVRFVVLYEQENVRAVGDAVADWLEKGVAESASPMPEAKALAKAWRNGLDPLFRGAPHLVLAVTDKANFWSVADSAIALTYLELAALSRGVGACWAGYITAAARQYDPLQKMLGLAEHEEVQGGQLLGFPSTKPTASAPRHLLPVSWL